MAKASRPRFELDHVGIGQILTSSEVRALVDQAAQQMAANLRGMLPGDVPVDVELTTSDRSRASVAIAHPSGVARQLKSGALTRAAGQLGISVRSR